MFPVDTHRQAGMPTREAIRLFLRYLQRFSTNTKQQYGKVLWRFCTAMPDFVKMVTAEHIDRFVGSLKMSNNSKNTTLIPIRSLFKYLNSYYNLPNTANKVKDLPGQPHRQRVISEIERSKLLKVCKPKERAVIQFLANTGLRAQEFCELVPSNVSPDRKYITIIGKANKRRIIPLNSCREYLDIIFSKSHTRNSLYWLCKKLSHKAGIPRFGPHALRHYFITELIKRGVSLAIVSRIAGHSNPVITMKIYCHLLVPDFIGCTDCLDG